MAKKKNADINTNTAPSLEELQKANVELVSANEELRETNGTLVSKIEILEKELETMKNANSADGTTDEQLAAYNEKANEMAKTIEELQEELEEYAAENEKLKAAISGSKAIPVPGKYKKKSFKDGYIKVACPAGVDGVLAGTVFKSEDLIKAAAGEQIDGLTQAKAKAILDRLIEIKYGGFA